MELFSAERLLVELDRLRAAFHDEVRGDRVLAFGDAVLDGHGRRPFGLRVSIERTASSGRTSHDLAPIAFRIQRGSQAPGRDLHERPCESQQIVAEA
jgi:hypothetical protein